MNYSRITDAPLSRPSVDVEDFVHWLDANSGVEMTGAHSRRVLTRAALAGLLGIGIERDIGGAGGWVAVNDCVGGSQSISVRYRPSLRIRTLRIG
jgi:hypothetical protein